MDGLVKAASEAAKDDNVVLIRYSCTISFQRISLRFLVFFRLNSGHAFHEVCRVLVVILDNWYTLMRGAVRPRRRLKQ